MIIGLVLSSVPGYSETFFRNKIKVLTKAGKKVIVFTDNKNGITTDHKLVEGFAWKGRWFTKVKNIILAILRLIYSPKKAQALYSLNQKSGFSKKENLLSLLSSAHILKFKLDWIHFGFATAALGRENLASILNAKMAVSIRGFDIAVYSLKNPDCYHLLWQHTDKLHYLSDDLRILAEKQGFNTQTPNQKITPAIDTSLFHGKRNYSFGSPIKIVSVARLHWIKGLEYVLETLSLLNKSGVDFEYTIIGEGNDYERLVFAAYQLGIKEKVFFEGKKAPQEIKKILQESDIYVQYSIHEGFCNAVLEAQAMGLLCVVSDGGGLPENVLHERTGWVVSKRNPKALADQLIKVMNLSESDRIRISQAAIKRVKEKFSLKKQRKEFENFYEI